MTRQISSTRSGTRMQPGDTSGSSRPYKRNFLKQVLCRIDFAAAIPELEARVPIAVEKVIKKLFPIAEPKKQVLQQVFFSTSAGLHHSKTETQQWIYHSKDRSKVINLTGEFFYVEYKKYKSFAVLQEDFHRIADAVFEAFHGAQAKRLGLRYIDNIEFPHETEPTDWSKYIQPDLLAGLKLADDRKTVARYFNVLEFAYPDMRMRFQYGMPNPDFPAPIRQKLFVLDFDAFCDHPIGGEEIPAYLALFHDKISASFEEVITEGLRDVMGRSHA